MYAICLNHILAFIPDAMAMLISLVRLALSNARKYIGIK